MWEIFRAIRPVWLGGTSAVSIESRDLNPATCTPTDMWGQPNDWMGGGQYVTANKALSVPAVWDAVRKVSETLASLPLDLFQTTEDGAAPAKGHPVRYLIRTEPSPNVTSYDFRRALFARACFGDAFARIHRNGIGRPVRLELMNGKVTVVELDNGGAAYVWDFKRGNSTGRETLFPYEVLHIKGFSLDTFRGLDVSSTHRDTLGFAIGANQYGNAFFANNASVDKVVKVPFELKGQQRQQLIHNLSTVSGVKKTGSAVILDGGISMEKIGLSPEESMLNESRGFQVNEVARVFGVPVHLLQNMDRATFNNIEMMTTLFVTLCLRPWAVQSEQEMLIKLLTRQEKESETYFFRHNFEGLLRGDTATRSAFYASAVLNGWMTRNEVREKENLNRLEGLEKPLVPVNMAIINEDGEIETQTLEQNAPMPGEPGSGGKKQDDGTPQTESAK
jgi:HK97 family phage portal protein